MRVGCPPGEGEYSQEVQERKSRKLGESWNLVVG